MVFNGSTFIWVVFICLGIWMGLLTAFFVRLWSHYNRLTNGVTRSGLKDVLESILSSQSDAQRQIVDIKKALQLVVTDGKKHIQRMSVVRFNPFQDTGGSQSFTMAILDAEEDGFVMTSLFARNGHRWYIKEVERGRGKDFELSKEEETAIKKARLS